MLRSDMLNGTPKISVILPVFNREKYICRAIDSILNQTYKDWELIVVDDGSTDGSGEICDQYEKDDRRIRVFHTENLGVSHARNIGLANAKGEWVAFLDSDDEYIDNALETMLNESSDVDAVIGASLCLPQYEVYRLSTVEDKITKTLSSLSEIAFQDICFFTVWGKLFRYSAISGLYFDEGVQYEEDLIFSLYAIKRNLTIKYIPYIIYYYHRETDNSLVKCFHFSKLASAKKILELRKECFSKVEMIQHALRSYCTFAARYFLTLICNDKIESNYKFIVVQLQLDENIACIDYSENPDLPAVYGEAWDVLKTGDAEKVIAWYEKNGEKLIKAFEKKEADDSQIPQSRFLVQLAGINVEIRHRYDTVREKCSAYFAPASEAHDISTYAPQCKIEFSKQYQFNFDKLVIDDARAEYDALPYQFYGELPKFNAFWLHSVVIEKNGVGYAFSAQPGVGKSTHAALWLKAFPDAHIINGDNPIIRLNPEDGKFYAWGTPFCGKEGYNENRGVPLKAVCFLERGEENEIHRVRPEFALTRLMKDNFCINSENGEAHYNLYKIFIEKTEFYSLKCNMDIEAAEVAYAGLSHQD